MVARFSPFTYFDPLAMVMGGKLPLWSVALLAGIAVGGVAVAYVVFVRRDISR